MSNPAELSAMVDKLNKRTDHRTFTDVIAEYRDAFGLLSRPKQ
jgi:hypothetical protein